MTLKTPEILVVDDSDFDLKLLEHFLAQLSDFHLTLVKSGELALKLLGERRFDMVLLDSNMPGVTGLQTLKAIRQKHTTLELPVIMVTSNAESSDIIEALLAGANDYVTKPVDFAVASARITTHLSLRQLADEVALNKERRAVQGLIATFNHELNTPLSAAMMDLEDPELDPRQISRVRLSVTRMVDIVQKISDLMKEGDLQIDSYANGELPIVRLKKGG